MIFIIWLTNYKVLQHQNWWSFQPLGSTILYYTSLIPFIFNSSSPTRPWIQFFLWLSSRGPESPLYNTSFIELPHMTLSLAFNENWAGENESHRCSTEYLFIEKVNPDLILRACVSCCSIVLLTFTWYMNLRAWGQENAYLLWWLSQYILDREWNLRNLQFFPLCFGLIYLSFFYFFYKIITFFFNSSGLIILFLFFFATLSWAFYCICIFYILNFFF